MNQYKLLEEWNSFQFILSSSQCLFCLISYLPIEAYRDLLTILIEIMSQQPYLTLTLFKMSPQWHRIPMIAILNKNVYSLTFWKNKMIRPPKSNCDVWIKFRVRFWMTKSDVKIEFQWNKDVNFWLKSTNFPLKLMDFDLFLIKKLIKIS